MPDVSHSSVRPAGRLALRGRSAHAEVPLSHAQRARSVPILVNIQITGAHSRRLGYRPHVRRWIALDA